MADVHAVPSWQEHELSPACWCGPVYVDEFGGRAWTHRAAHDDPHRYPEDRDPAMAAPGRQWLVEVLPD